MRGGGHEKNQGEKQRERFDAKCGLIARPSQRQYMFAKCPRRGNAEPVQ
jgi:hypothetical protein